MIDPSVVRARLARSIGTGEIIGVRYFGGSQPGSYREIVPLQCEHVTLRAFCRTSGAQKQFRYDRIEVCEGGDGAAMSHSVWDADAHRQVRFQTMRDLFQRYSPELIAQGWHVQVEPVFGGGAICLYRRTKAGVLRKHPSVTLSHEALTYDLVFMPDGTEAKHNMRPRARPWSVRGAAGASKGTWATLEGAVPIFLAEAGLRQMDDAERP